MKDFLGISMLAVIGVLFAVFFMVLGNLITEILF
jgi:hypothetical protein